MSEVSADDVRKVIAGFGPIKVKLGKLKVFAGSDTGKDFDVIYIEIISPDAERLNEKIAKSLPNVKTQERFVPHLTIAYVRPGFGDQHAGDWSQEGKELTFDRLVFKDRQGSPTTIMLSGQHNLALEVSPAFVSLGLSLQS